MASTWGAKAVNSVKTGDTSKDVQMESPPQDGISDLSWSPVVDYLAVSSWDNKVRIYDVTRNAKGSGIAAIDFGGPVLSCDWSKDGTKVVGAGADKTACILDLGTPGAPAQQVALHDSPIRCVRFFEAPNTRDQMLVTGSWDRTAKYWDLRSPRPAGILNFAERIYALDVKDALMVIATADENIHIVDLNDSNNVWRTRKTPMKHQIRAVSCFLDATGFAVGSVEGRCSFQWVTDQDHTTKSYSFKCHRDTPINSNTTNIWTINSISTHPIHGTFATVGSDGTYQFWDKEWKRRLKEYRGVGGPISAGAFSRDGKLFAYAVSYDWSMGYVHSDPQKGNLVMLHSVLNDDVTPTGKRAGS